MANVAGSRVDTDISTAKSISGHITGTVSGEHRYETLEHSVNDSTDGRCARRYHAASRELPLNLARLSSLQSPGGRVTCAGYCATRRCSDACDAIPSEGGCIDCRGPTRVQRCSHAAPAPLLHKPCMPTIPKRSLGKALRNCVFAPLRAQVVLLSCPSLPIVFPRLSFLDVTHTTPRSLQRPRRRRRSQWATTLGPLAAYRPLASAPSRSCSSSPCSCSHMEGKRRASTMARRPGRSWSSASTPFYYT